MRFNLIAPFLSIVGPIQAISKPYKDKQQSVKGAVFSQ
jgi:hypothetical protein